MTVVFSCFSIFYFCFFFFSSRRRHTRLVSDWSSDVCSSDLRDDNGRAVAFIPSSRDRATIVVAALALAALVLAPRSEERRVGKECRCRGSACHEKKKY